MIKYFLILLFLALSACGTETGNPGGNPGNQNGTATAGLTSLDLIIQASCSRIQSCHNEQLPTCNKRWLELSHVDEEIGLTQGQYTNLQAVQLDLVDGKLKANTEAANLCRQDIKALSCFGTGVEEAYNTDLANPFYNGDIMLPLSCKDTFKGS